MWKCKGLCDTETVIAKPVWADCQEFVQVDRYTGESTNMFEDGIVGVPDDMARAAEEDEEPVCPSCFNYCDWMSK